MTRCFTGFRINCAQNRKSQLSVNIFESHSQITLLLVSISERDWSSMAGARQCKVLNVAEKNDAARELAKIMSRGRFQRVSTIRDCIMATGLLVGCNSCQCS